MKETKFMPEDYYSIDNEMSAEKISRAHSTGDFLIGKVVLWDSQNELLKVSLGNGYNGIIPIDECTIYPVTCSPSGLVSASIYTLIGKTICVCVKSFSADTIILSRKEIMLKAFDHICNNINEVIDCQITSLAPFGVFVDVGCGITGLIHVKDLTVSRVNDPSVVGFTKKQFLHANIVSIDTDKRQVSLEHKSLCPNLAKELHVNDMLDAIILSQLNDDGYFAHVNANTSAIVDVPINLEIPYGSKIICRVKKCNSHSDKLRLDFVTFVN